MLTQYIRYLFIILICTAAIANVQGQKKIFKAEYFFDTDPGFNNASQVLVPTPVQDVIGLSISPNIASLSTGLHTLFVRVEDSNFVWSQTIPTLFFKEANLATTAANITKLEYFIDTDPGFGVASDVPVSGTTTVLNGTAFVPSLVGLSAGLHNLFVRTQDANGKWSQTIPTLFFKEANLATTTPNITKLEYFIDTDPGFGMATDVPVSGTTTTLTGTAFTPTISGLQNGLHNLFVRTQDANGKWSQTIPNLFFKEANLATTAPNITKLEYFIDTDPGFGMATDVPVSGTTTTLTGTAFAPSISSLQNGLHNLFVRTKDATGNWSQSIPTLFFKEANLATTAPNITKLEYFIDTDPGFGAATDVPVSGTTTILTGTAFSPSLSGLQNGLHNLFVRTKDATGNWSQSIPQLFYKEADLFVAAQNLTKLEYFIDQDPGFGSAINVPFTPNTNIASLNFLPSLSSLNIGLHWLGVRAKEQGGKWGETTSQLFYYEPVRGPYHPRIVRAEYYFDNPVPFGTATPLVIKPQDTVTAMKFPVNVTGLSSGNHRFFLRTLSDSGRWSLTSYADVTVTSTASGPAIYVNSFTPNVTCAGNLFLISFDATGTYNLGNIFTAQLSDASGSFSAPTTIGSIAATNSSIISAATPTNLPGSINSYKIRVVSSNNPVIGATSDSTFGVITNAGLGSDTTIFFSCTGDTYNLNSLYNASSGGVWNTGNITTAPPGQYKYYVSSSGCNDTANVTLVLDVATWTGAVNTDWHTAANWSTNNIPTQFTHVIIPSGTPNCIISTADAMAASVQVRNGANARTTNGRNLLIKGKCAALPN